MANTRPRYKRGGNLRYYMTKSPKRGPDMNSPKFFSQSDQVSACNLKYYKTKRTVIPKKVSFTAPAAIGNTKHSCLIVWYKRPSVENGGTKSKSLSEEDHKVESALKDVACVEKPRGLPQCSSREAVEALRGVWKQKLLSHTLQIAADHPLAEFENFVESASPFIPLFYRREKYDICCNTQSSNHPCPPSKQQIPNIALKAIWSWYEEPSNYGLDVEQHCQSLGLIHAYFKPSLSAIQLFGYSQLSSSCTDLHFPKTTFWRESLGSAAVDLMPAEITNLHPISELEDKPELLPKLFQRGGDHSSTFIYLPAFSADCELVFQFIESELPHERKPLHMKIEELINAGPSNTQVYGDTASLESMNLHDLHPASWFSVAWYPVYRIPDWGTFRAAFLTYHSLGHCVGKHIPTNSLKTKIFPVSFPVVGLKSYRARSEGWLDLREPTESSRKGSLDRILWERLRTLAYNALLLSGGIVMKNEGSIQNKYLDRDFFMSRGD